MLKKLIFLFLFVLSGLLASGQNLPPRSNTLVTDYTNTLSPEDKARLEQKLVAFNDSTTTQIAVVILKTVGNYEINQYGAALIRAWGIGQKGKNNGILVLVALADRKVSIQTGYGAEASVPDIVTHDIIQNDITPNFKQGKYYEGLDAAITSLMAHIKGEYHADAKAQGNNVNTGDDNTGSSIAIIVVIVVVILIIIFRKRGGGGGQIISRRGGSSPFWWFLAGSFWGSSNNSGGFFGNNDSGGGGGFGGGDSGGGDFGGFGGGDSGGGGSSGSW